VSARIFVQVPEYRDAELDATLHDLTQQAEHPERLRVVVLSQRAATDAPVRVPERSASAFEVVSVPAAESRGPNWARRMLQDRYDGEEYSLVIDSHLRLVGGWDTRALAMLDELGERSAKPILTAYLPSYLPGHVPDVARAPSKIYPLRRDRGVLTRLTSHPLHAWRHLEHPITAEYLSLHFVLAPGSIVHEVPHDPEVYFFGDEVAYGFRAFAHGWDLYHPHRVLGWHAYDRATRRPHWDDHAAWGVQHEETLSRLRRLFTGDPDLAGLAGDRRSVAEYERHIMTPLVLS
jgi:hypothetical protein